MILLFYYYASAMTYLVKLLVFAVGRCARANPKTHSEKSELHPVKVSKDIFHRWGIDMVGPLQQTARGNTYIITATEYLTK